MHHLFDRATQLSFCLLMVTWYTNSNFVITSSSSSSSSSSYSINHQFAQLYGISVRQQMTVFWLADVIGVAVYVAQASMYVSLSALRFHKGSFTIINNCQSTQTVLACLKYLYLYLYLLLARDKPIWIHLRLKLLSLFMAHMLFSSFLANFPPILKPFTIIAVVLQQSSLLSILFAVLKLCSFTKQL